jgi:hypothetical protein
MTTLRLSRRTLRRALPVLAIPALALGVAACGDDDSDGPNTAAASYEVTVTNVNATQSLTPPVAVTHAERDQYFSVGSAAPAELQAIAENGNAEPALESWTNAILGAETPLVPDGSPAAEMFPGAATFTIDSQEGEGYLSLASMLICTNDGFTGVQSLELPAPGEEVTVSADAYDAGTEQNTEMLSDMVPPCQDLSGVTGAEGTGESNPALAEGGEIGAHPGLAGTGDLTEEAHGVSSPVAEIMVRNLG